MSTISDKTAEEYRRISEAWMTKQLDACGLERKAETITKMLRAWSDGKRPTTFRKMRRALMHHQAAYPNTVRAIASTERIGHGEANTMKKRRCKRVTEAEHKRLLDDAARRKDVIMDAALRIAYLTGIRPAEMPHVQVIGIQEQTGRIVLLVPGAKKSKSQGRGMDKQIAVDDPDIVYAVDAIHGLDDSGLTALKQRLSQRSHTLWPRRKTPPTLYSYRHTLGSDLKRRVADRRQAAAIMGHASQKSLSVYGHKNSSGGLKREIPSISTNTLKKVQIKSPKPIPQKRVPTHKPERSLEP